jgi:hypothetical protein
MDSDRTNEALDDDRLIVETARERDGPQTAGATIGAHVQDLLRGIADFVRGRDAHEHTNDRER